MRLAYAYAAAGTRAEKVRGRLSKPFTITVARMNTRVPTRGLPNFAV